MRSVIAAAKPLTVLLGLGAACAACCLLPGAAFLTGGAFLGSLFAGVGFGLFGWAGAAAAGLIVLALSLAWWRRRPASRDVSQAACGCGVPAKTIAEPKLSLPIACTLSPHDRKSQIERIRQLTRNALRAARREPLKLHLTYAQESGEQVREVVRVESSCCAFLDFELRDDAQGVQLTITAPERAKDAAQLLFDQFAPTETTAQVT
jgi:hypothetical protein